MKNKRVLIITYYWPPSGGIGVIRCLKLVKYIRQFGWEPVVFTAENAHYPSIDHSNEGDIPKDVEVIKQKIIEPHSLYKFLTGKKQEANVNDVFYTKKEKSGIIHRFSIWVRSNFFIPDARYLWIKPSLRKLQAYLKEHPVDAIISSAPPHTCTRIATLLKRKLGIPIILDFRDPWTQIDYFKQLQLTSGALAKHQRMEQEAFDAADKILIVSPSWKKDLESIGAKNVEFHYNGYDSDDFKNLKYELSTTKFTLVHIGIMGFDRNPKVFFEVIKELCHESNEYQNDFELLLVGQVDYSVKETYTNLGIEKNVTFAGSVPRNKALQYIAQSPVLLLLLNQQENAKGRIPGKVFEYLAVRRTILCLGPENSDVAKILSSSRSGVNIEYDNHNALKQALKDLYDQWKKGELTEPIDSDIEKYSHQHLARKMAGYLNEITHS